MEAGTDIDLATNDLGPLAWVLDELRKSLDSASAALRRFVRDAGLARGSDMASVDEGQLRIARQQLHQAVGALEMVGLEAPAHVLRAMEAAVQKFVERPELCTEPAAAKVERAGFALTEYLEGVLLGKPASAVALFPQYRDVQELAGADRIHPADLWALNWRWIEPETPAVAQALVYGPSVRSRLDQTVLRVVKTGDCASAAELVQICLALAASQSARQPKIYWKICAGYFEAMALGLLPLDLYVKRGASRVLLQYASLAKGELGVSDRLAQDLLFFCAQAVPSRAADAPALTGVRLGYGLARFQPVDYQTAQYGRFDPVLLAQARKRIGVAKETWSALSGGDANKLKGAGEQFHLVSDSLTKLHPSSAPMAQSLSAAVDAVVRSGQAPRAELAMEVATAVLYLEAAFEDLDPTDSQLAGRTARLGQRLDQVRQGSQPEPLEPWMEELYRRVSDRQTMGSVVGELRATLGELEKLLDNFFRNPQDKASLQNAPAHLTQMRGVLSVLGLDQASQAVLRMRESVEQIIVTEVDEAQARAAGTFDKLGNNLGALGFLIDMLHYQPTLAKKLFVYDDKLGELKPLMGRTQDRPPEVPAAAEPPAAAEAPVLAAVEPQPIAPELPPVPVLVEITPRAPVIAPAVPAAVAPPPAVAKPQPQAVAAAPADADNEDDELLDIFLEEAREVVQTGLAAIDALGANPRNLGELTTLRRAFHTLKGSSRMVGLNEFGEAGWSMEQVMNTWLADQKPASDALRTLAADAMRGFARWIEDIAVHQDTAWKAGMFRGPADALRTDNRLIALVLPEPAAPAANEPRAQQAEPVVALAVQAAAESAVIELPSLFAELPAAAPVAKPESTPVLVPVEAALQVVSEPLEGLGDEPVRQQAAEPEAASEAALSDQEVIELFGLPAKPEPAIESMPEPLVIAPAPPESQAIAEAPADVPDWLSFDSTQILRPDPDLAPAAERPATDLAADFDFDFDLEIGSDPQAGVALAAPAAAFESIDFGSLAALSGPVSQAGEIDLSFEPPLEASPAASEPAVSAAPSEPPLVLGDFELAQPVAEPEPLLDADLAIDIAFDPEPVLASIDEQIKVIGTMRIGIPLYNVYLNEADEWSRRLVTDVGEWALELNQRVPDSAVGLAHALAGSSATVGFHTLSDIARALESALQKTQLLAYGTPEHGQAFIAAAEEIRRLLHQFAAGFLKEPDPRVSQALAALESLDLPKRADLHDSTRFDLDGMFDLDDLRGVAQPAANVDPTGPAPAELSVDAAAVPAPVEPEPAFDGSPAEPAAAIERVIPFQPVASALIFEEPLVAEVRSEPEPELPAVAVATEPAQDLVSALSVEKPAVLPEPAAPLRSAATAMPPPVLAPSSTSAQASLSDEEDEIDIADAVDPDLFPIFEEEALELMPQLGTALRQWAARPDNRSARDEVLRVLHTLKGSARLAGALRLGEASHRLESEIEHLDAEAVASADIEPLLHRFDNMQARFDVLRLGEPVSPAEPEPAPAPETSAEPLLPAAAESVPTPVAQRALLARPVTTIMAPQRAAANQAVRVRSQLLDRLVNQAGEVMITRSRLEAELSQLRSSLADLTGNLDRLRAQLRDIELQAESQMQSRLAQAKDSAAGFDPLEFDRFTRVQELTRMMAESVNDVATVQRNLQRTVESTEDDLIAQARQTRELQRDLLRTRMVEFEGISDRLYRVVRLASKETGKQVKLDITGGSIEMDRGVLDRMTPAFEHLLRNCVAHGVEEPAVRAAAGKDPIGTIVIGLHHEGNDVSVEFHDDGAGLNLPRIREKARQQGLIAEGHELTDAEAANMIFMPGFSTASQVTELSGRGIGMDVVRSDVNALGGRIETTTQPGQGTNFKLVLPLTTAVTQVVMIRSGSLSVGVPANLVEIVRRATAKEVQQAYNTGLYEFGGEQLPFFWSGALLQASQRSNEPQSKTLPVVVFRSAAQRIAMHVDEVLGNQEVVVKNLGPQLSRLAGLAGMTVLASGAVVLIYNPVALTTVYGDQARQLSADHAQPEVLEQASAGAARPATPQLAAPPQVPLVLVVDDSITVRRVTQRLLQREGYRVSLAADGLQALERLAEERPTVVLSDIEMPRMDGFDLARNIRGDARLKDLPIVMITSRIAEKHREHAILLGVNHYLGKPYAEEELLSLVRHYSSAAVAV